MALGALMLPLAGAPSHASSPRLVLGWNYGGTTSTYLSQDAAAPGLNTVSPFWWTLRSDGAIADNGNAAYVAWAHAHGKGVWPMFANNLDQVASRRAMTDAALRSQVIAKVRDLARHYGVDGINVDWEDLATSDRDAYSGFVRQAVGVWHAAGFVTSVDISARTDHWQLGDWSESFDQRALGAAADYVVLMAYDEHNRLKPDGPTASLPWVEDSVRYLLRSTSANKVILGVPFYSNEWDDTTKKGSVITYAETYAHVRAHHAVVTWDEHDGSNLARYTLAGHTHHLWFEDPRSLSLKAALVNTYGLAGVAAWRIGFETPDAWRAIDAAPVARSAPPPTARPTTTPAPTPHPTATAAPTHLALASPPPTRPASGRSTFSLVAAFIAFAAAAGAAFAFRRLRLRG